MSRATKGSQTHRGLTSLPDRSPPASGRQFRHSPVERVLHDPVAGASDAVGDDGIDHGVRHGDVEFLESLYHRGDVAPVCRRLIQACCRRARRLQPPGRRPRVAGRTRSAAGHSPSRRVQGWHPGPCAGGAGSCLGSWFFEALDAVDGGTVHIELEPDDSGALGQLEQVCEVGFQRRVVARRADVDEAAGQRGIGIHGQLVLLQKLACGR
mmetsp:Transcript_54621/g.133538  ORF Transcript_54621/g.133538 Transcript_54621/m.133538 type:complete len:210 (-) Transcript_54621:510-1139(-)